MNILKITLSIFLLTVSISVFTDLNNGLIAYYPFNGNANDESGHNNNGIVHGASLTTDRFENQNSAYSLQLFIFLVFGWCFSLPPEFFVGLFKK